MQLMLILKMSYEKTKNFPPSDLQQS